MSLLRYVEPIHTECDKLGNPILNVKAIKLDGKNGISLKEELKCSIKSCDYLRKKNKVLYFIELSDLQYQLRDLISDGKDEKEAKRIIKEGIRQKISDSLLIFSKFGEKFIIDESKIKRKKVLLTLCSMHQYEVVAFDYLKRSFESSYKPAFIDSFQVIPLSSLEKIL